MGFVLCFGKFLGFLAGSSMFCFLCLLLLGMGLDLVCWGYWCVVILSEGGLFRCLFF